MFKLLPTALEEINFKKDMKSLHAGGFCSFEGWVRDVNDGRNVVALEYEAVESLCENEMQKIFAEARQKFQVMEMQCFHRVGKLAVGEMAVWIGVTGVHRDEAFKACRYLIDEIKKRLPIWKKEYYSDGQSSWVNCSCSTHAAHYQ